MDVNDVTERIIGAGIAVHRALGPGLLESAYQMCLLHELLDRGLLVESDRSLPVRYKNVTIDCAYRIDMLVENAVIVELKSVARIDRIHVAQMLTTSS